MDWVAGLQYAWGYLLSGGIGFALGAWWWERRTMRRRNEGGITRVLPLIGALSLLTLVLALALTYTLVQVGVAKERNVASQAALDVANDQIDVNRTQITDNEAQADCQQNALEHLIAGLLPRAAFAEQEADIQRVYVRQFGIFLGKLQDNTATPRDFDDLAEANHVRYRALVELLDSLSTDELPSLSEIERCRN